MLSQLQRQAKDYRWTERDTLGDALLYGVTHQFGVIFEMQFLEDPRSVGTDRRRAEMHAFGDL